MLGLKTQDEYFSWRLQLRVSRVVNAEDFGWRLNVETKPARQLWRAKLKTSAGVLKYPYGHAYQACMVRKAGRALGIRQRKSPLCTIKVLVFPSITLRPITDSGYV